MAVVSTLAVALRSFSYGETSLILRFYTRELGLVGVMAKGARKAGSRGRGVPETFSRGVLTLYVKEGRDLHTMKDFSPERVRRGLARHVTRFAAASVLAEIILRHTREEGSPRLFEILDQALDALERVEGDELIAEVLSHGWKLVRELGYLPGLSRCVRCGSTLGEQEMSRFDFGAGGVRCSRCMEEAGGPRLGPGAREQLDALLRGERLPDVRRPRAHLRLLEDYVTYHLSEGRPLDSFRILQDVIEVL